MSDAETLKFARALCDCIESFEGEFCAEFWKSPLGHKMAGIHNEAVEILYGKGPKKLDSAEIIFQLVADVSTLENFIHGVASGKDADVVYQARRVLKIMKAIRLVRSGKLDQVRELLSTDGVETPDKWDSTVLPVLGEQKP